MNGLILFFYYTYPRVTCHLRIHPGWRKDFEPATTTFFTVLFHEIMQESAGVGKGQQINCNIRHEKTVDLLRRNAQLQDIKSLDKATLQGEMKSDSNSHSLDYHNHTSPHHGNDTAVFISDGAQHRYERVWFIPQSHLDCFKNIERIHLFPVPCAVFVCRRIDAGYRAAKCAQGSDKAD